MVKKVSRSSRSKPLLLASVASMLLFVLSIGCANQSANNELSSVLEKAESSVRADQDPIALVSGGEAAVRPASSRRIIYTAHIEMTVDDFSVFERNVADVISKHDGFAAERTTDRRHGDHRDGNWVIRVPVHNYDAFLTGLDALGFAKSRSETSDDVTEAYVDLEARISNQRKLEQRMIAMVDERPGKLSELLEIERELSRVREEIERMEGRMRVLADQTSLATVHLRVSEEATYEPPTAPTLGERVASAWGGSLASIQSFASGLLVIAVAIAPWCVILSPSVFVAYRIGGRIRTAFQRRFSAVG